MNRTPDRRRKLNKYRSSVSEYNNNERRYTNLSTLDTLNHSNFPNSSKRQNNTTKFFSSDRNKINVRNNINNRNKINNSNNFVNTKPESSEDSSSFDEDDDYTNDTNNNNNGDSDEDSSLDDNNSSGDYSDYSSNNSDEIDDKTNDDHLGPTKSSNSYLRSYTKSTTSSNEKTYKCYVLGCEKSFKKFGNLANHEKIHIDKKRLYERNKSERECKKKFKRSNNNSTKRKIGEKSYKCNESGCKKKYTSISSLKVHRRIHTNEKPYKCAKLGCNEVFRSLYFLRLHSKKLNHEGYSYTKYNNN